MPGDDPLPKVTPSLLRGASRACPRRLHAEHTGADGSDDPVNRARLREPFLDAARTAHALGGPPRREAFRVPAHLEPEEQHTFTRAARAYLELYGDRPVITHLHDCERPTEDRSGTVRLGGWVDLTVERDDGTPELRQLKLSTGPVPTADDPLELESVWLAVLRLAPWIGARPVVVSWADLTIGECRERTVQPATELPELEARLVDRLAVVHERAAPGATTPGSECGSCRYLKGCPEHPGAIRVSAGARSLLPGTVVITPTRLQSWLRCRRAWRAEHVLSLPASDPSAATFHGMHTHALLRTIHEHGSCHDAEHVADVLEANGGNERLREELVRHESRCPSPAESLGNERELARYHRRSGRRPFMTTARIDAIWVHDGVLDARDYKTGAATAARLADDAGARVQAWVLAPLAARHGLVLQLRYEHLAPEVDDDPEPWEPDAGELEGIGAELQTVVEAMHTEHDWHGVAEAAICGSCRYRSICPDSVIEARA